MGSDRGQFGVKEWYKQHVDCGLEVKAGVLPY